MKRSEKSLFGRTADRTGTGVRHSAVIFVCLAVLCFALSPKAWAGVMIYDMVALQGGKVMLRAETRGKVFRKGGELVEFSVNGESLGRTLSGGDGVAYKPFMLQKTGLYEVKVKFGAEEDTGLVLSLEKGTGLVFVDVEDSLVEGLFSRSPKAGGKEAVEQINRLFPVVFLQRGLVGIQMTEDWLKDHGFPRRPVVAWDKGKIFGQITSEGLGIEAIIGSKAVIESAAAYGPRSFGFVPAEGGIWVKDWDEIKEAILKDE